MEMVGHQRVRVQLALETPGERGKVMKEELVIRLGVETCLAVVPTLDDVHGESNYL